MKSHTSGFKNAIKNLGRELRAVITYGNTTLEEEIYSVTPHFEGNILKSIMKQLDLELSVDIPLETVLNCRIGILVNNSYEMLNFGNYVVYKSEKQEDTNTYKLTCYDKILYSMKQNEDLGITYPISIKNYLKAVLRKIGLTLKTTTFQNERRMIQNELYLGLDYTYRDILDEIAQATGSIICLNENDEVLVKYPTQTNDTIDEEFLKDVNVDFGQMYGAINTIVLSRSGESDNIYYPETLPENPIEIKIKDNQIMNWNDRSDYLPGIYNALNELYYYINDFSSTGIMYYEVGDLYNVQVGNNTYQCLMLNDEINITTGIEETIHTDLSEQSETDYTKADKTDRKLNQTYLIVDKQNQQIESLITTQTDQNQKIARVTQTVDELNSKISDIADITTSLETNFARLEFEGINQSEPIRVVIHPIGVNIAKLHPSPSLKPSANLVIKTRILRFKNTTTNEVFDYELPGDLLYYDSEHYDEFILDYDSQTCVINKKCKWNNDGTVGLLASERTDEYEYPTIELTDGDYEVSLIKYSNGYLFVRLMAQNIYTTQFATRAELNSDIRQTVDNINLSVNSKLSNYSTTTEMNSAIDLKANQITSNVSENYATKSELNSSTSSLNSKIDQTAQSISLTVDSVQEQVETAQSTADTATTKADNAQSSANSAQSTANSATTKANNAQTSANNAQATADSINTNLTTNYYTKTQTNSAINQKADSITSTVSQTYSTKTETTAAKNAAINSANASTDTKLQSYSTTTQMNTAIEQKANSITSSVSQTYSTKTETASAIDNIKIGGTNLLRFTQSGENWVKSSFNEQELTFTRKTTSTGESFITHPKAYLALEKNTQYTLSAWIKSNGKVKSLDIWCYDKNTDHPQSKSNISVNTTWQFVTWTFTTNNYSNSDYSQTTIRFDNNGSTTQGQNAILYVKKPKLEIGNKATDWQPSSEDYSTTTEMNSAITQTATDINLEVSKKVGNNEIISKINQSAEAVQIAANKISLNGKSINLTSGNITISSDKFSVDKNGNITATGGTIGGFGLSSNSFSKQLNGLYDYSLFDLCMTRLNLLDVLDLSLDPTLVDMLDYNGDGDPNTVDYVNILKVIQGKITNTKTKQGTFRINANNPKNCLTVEDSSGDVCVSLGMGGVNSNIVITKNIICSNTKTESREVPYILIDGINGQISLHNTTTSGPALTRIKYDEIITPLITPKLIKQKSDTLLTEIKPSEMALKEENTSNAIEMKVWQYDTYKAYILLSDDNGNKTRITPAAVYTPTVVQTSLENEKKNFEKYENALETLKNIDIYKYNLKSEEDNTKKHIGFVIGDKYKYSEEVTSKNNDGVDIYSFVSLCCKAIQEQEEQRQEDNKKRDEMLLIMREQQKQIEELQKEIKELKGGK